jgi:aspartyl-tRNA(Asn)/glutamyl-tRNA(Gln) amidotransferase subunit C
VAVTREEVLKIAELSKLSFSAAELEDFVVQFQRILDYVEQLNKIDVAHVEPTSHVSLTEDFESYICRPDRVGTSLSAEDSLQGAPDPGNGHFRVPKVIESR